MNARIRHALAALSLLALAATNAMAGAWTENIMSNQNYSGTAVIPTNAVNPVYTQYWACYIGTTICDGPYGNFTMNAGAMPDSYDYGDQKWDNVTNTAIVAGGSYPVYLDQYGSP